MNYPTNLQAFIANNPNTWESCLTGPPYYLKVKRSDDGRVLFKYNQINSDMTIPLCREARGIILDENTLNIVAIAFSKFFNYGEPLAADIDWPSARIQEKVDGSIISLYFWNGAWRIKTNGTIEAADGEVEFPGEGIHTFSDLVHEAFRLYQFDPENMLKGYENYTFTFEVVSPYNRIVVPYSSIQLYYLTARHNATAEEKHIELPNVDTPREFSFESLDDILDSTKYIDFTQEGYVVVDKHYNRIKIKGEDYLRVHRIRGEAIPTERRILELILSGQADDFVGLFPEYAGRVDELKDLYAALENDITQSFVEYRENGWDRESNRKRFAVEFAKHTPLPSFFFALKDGKTQHIDDFLKTLSTDNLLKLLNAYR